MPLTDLPYEDLLEYRPDPAAPEGLDAFWADTLAESRALGGEPSVTRVDDALLPAFEVSDVRFPGYGGEPVAGWLLVPRGAAGPLPAVVEYLGYSQGRGLPLERLLFPSAGYAYLVMDSRGQGHDTPDPHPGDPQWFAGLMTRGVESPERYYYRRLYTDAVRAVDFVRGLPQVDADRVVVAGASQGGGLALAAAALAPGLVAAALVDVPFLQHFRRAVEIAAIGPYTEVAEYLQLHSREQVERTFATLDCFDGLHLAPRASAPALFSVGLMDPVCPPSTVFASYHRYGGRKDMEVWRFADHGGGRSSQQRRQLEWLHERGLGAKG